MRKLKSFKIRFADNLGHWMVSIKDGEILVHAIDGTIAIKPKDGENIQELRARVFELIKGVPANCEAVNGLLEIAL